MADSTEKATETYEEDNAFFKRMMDLIPPKVYFDQDMQEQLRSKRVSEDTSQDEPDGGERTSKKRKKKWQKNKEKKERDPFMCKSVTQIQEENLLNQSQGHESKKQKKKDGSFAVSVSPAMPGSSSSSTDDNRSKLRAKIEELQAKRKMKGETSLEEKRLRRKEKKLLQKQKRSKKKKEANAAKQLANSSVKGDNTKQTPTKPIYNSEGNLVYSKFDFTSTGKKKRKSDLTGKDYKRLLEKIEQRNEKLKKLKDKDEGAAANLNEKFKWDAALHKAEGEKVRDNPERLKKALKMKEKMKEKRKKKWEDREKNVEKLKEDKQNKRTRNINARKQAKKEKKIKKLQKKGRLIPGF